MRKQNYIAVVLVLFGYLVGSPSLLSQSRPILTRTALSRMDVLSRAGLFERTIADAARREGVDPLILWTIAYNETRFRPWLTSPKNARGLMQFIPGTAARFGLADPYEPTASIHAAARYVKYLDGLFGRKMESVLAAYNSGEGTVQAYLHGRTVRSHGKVINPLGRRTTGGIPPYRETANYVSQGMKIYRWLDRQGRFGKTPRTDSAVRIASSTSIANEDRFATVVLYNPRTGGRFRIENDGENNLQPLGQDGAVIISTDLRGLPAQKARSTFAGATRP